MTALFSLGDCHITPAALDAFMRCGQSPAFTLDRHVTGDWGECDQDDSAANDYAIGRELRILSAYKLPTGQRIWVITEADRSHTTILLPEEY